MKFKAKTKDHSWKKRFKEIQETADWSSDMMRFAVRIIDGLKSTGRTQKWLANRMGVSDQYVSKVLKGRVNMSWGYIRKIEAALDIKLARVEDVDCISHEAAKITFVDLINSHSSIEDHIEIDKLTLSMPLSPFRYDIPKVYSGMKTPRLIEKKELSSDYCEIYDLKGIKLGDVRTG